MCAQSPGRGLLRRTAAVPVYISSQPRASSTRPHIAERACVHSGICIYVSREFDAIGTVRESYDSRNLFAVYMYIRGRGNNKSKDNAPMDKRRVKRFAGGTSGCEVSSLSGIIS